MSYSEEQLENIFTYHKPTPAQVGKYAVLRAKGKELAYLINTSCPDSKEKRMAIMSLQQTIMWANASIAINEEPAE